MMEHAVINEVYFNSPETGGLDGARDVAVSGDGNLLFVTGRLSNALSVWRVNAEAGTLSQTTVYQDSGVPADSRIENVDGLVNGLDGATGVAVSGDGNLLFVTGTLSDALSVWRVNVEAGTLSQTAIYQDSGVPAGSRIENVDGLVNGLDGARDVAVSGNLLFVTGTLSDALSVWRVNVEAGELRRTALYRDGVNEIDGLGGAVSVAVSDDGKLLFVTGQSDDALSVWRVNAQAGSLIQTDLHRDGERGIDGLDGVWNVAVSGNLLFVTARSPDDALSVWRVNAQAGSLIQTDLHRNGERGINSLFEPTGLAVSDDGNLLFVSAFIGNSVLSVWRVNAEAGTLSQTVVYPNRTIDGLDGADNVAVSGDLLFVTGFFSDALGVWHINDAEVSLEVPTVIRVQLDRAVEREVMVTVTAQSGARMETAAVTFSPGILSEDAIFPAATLSPGRWIFTARMDLPDVPNMSAARTVLQVSPPLLSLEPQPEKFAVGNTVTLTVRAIAGVSADTTYRITALNRASPQTISPITVMHPAGSTEVTVFFPGQSLFTGQWEFSIQLPDSSPFRVGGGSTAIVRIIIPLLQLVPPQDQYAVGSTVTLSVQANAGAPTDATYEVIAVNAASEQTSFTVTVEHFANTIAQEVSFPARLFSTPGQWEFSIVLPLGSPFQVDRSVTISILAVDLSLQPGGELTMMENAALNEVYFNSPETGGLDGAKDVAVSGDGNLLFVTGRLSNALSVWRVNAEAGTLSQTAVYQDSGVPADSRIENVDGLVNGLDGATGVAVSGDGNLLFVTGTLSDALSVWRVNAEAGTLSQTAIYQDSGVPAGSRIENVDGLVNGLDGATDVAVSGNLLFVTAGFPGNALSVWRVNAEAGELRWTALYRDGVNEIDGLGGAVSVAVSDDGKLLFVTARIPDDALSVWRVNAQAGSLIQTDLHRDGERGIDGLGGVWNVAVSGNLLFVTARSPDDALSVWRVNAQAGSLIQTDLHRNGERGINSLFEPTGLAVSDDGNLLFVSAFIGNSVLSVWRVNAEAGTLSQTVVYPNRTIDGLDGADNVAVSGDLLFVTGFFSDALGVWHINDAEVSLEVPTVIRVQPDRAVGREVMVTVTAQSGARMETAVVTLSPETLSEDAIFPAGTLGPGGQWIFTARADSPHLLNTSAARTAVQVLPPLLQLVPLRDQYSVGNTVTLTVRAIAGVPAATTYRITALNRASLQTIPSITVVHPAGSTEVTVLIPGQSLSTGQWEFSIQLPDNSPFRVGGGSTATVRVVILLLQLVPLQDHYAVDSTVTLSVQTSAGALTDATYEVIAVNAASEQTSFTVTVEHFANTLAQEVSFPAQLFSSPGQWELSIVLPPGSPFQADSRVTIFILAPVLSLQPSGELTMMEHTAFTEVYFDSPETDGLDGVRDVVASGDLLFVTAFVENTLSVWRVNAEAGTLSQTARYRDDTNEIDGLEGVAGVAVSDDGKLLFVTGQSDDALSVWRVNADAGTLTQTEVYLDNEKDSEDGIDGLNGARDVAVSGNLLFVTAGFPGNALSVWRVNAEAGTLRRTALYRDGVGEIDGLDGAESIALSDDGKLLFVTARVSDRALSVWRVNAEEGSLIQTDLHQDGERGIDGLSEVWDVAVSGNLLFVTAGLPDNVLSVWRVNAEAGTLSQTALYQDSGVPASRRIGKLTVGLTVCLSR